MKPVLVEGCHRALETTKKPPQPTSCEETPCKQWRLATAGRRPQDRSHHRRPRTCPFASHPHHQEPNSHGPPPLPHVWHRCLEENGANARVLLGRSEATDGSVFQSEHCAHNPSKEGMQELWDHQERVPHARVNHKKRVQQPPWGRLCTAPSSTLAFP